MSSRRGVGGDGWSWGVTVFLDKLRSSELNLKREVIILYRLCFLTKPKGWRISVEMLHPPHGLSTERGCSANLHQNVFWLGKREVCNEKFWQPCLCLLLSFGMRSCSWVQHCGWELPSVGGVPPDRCSCATKFPVARKVPVYLLSTMFWCFLFLFILQVWIPKYCLTLWNHAERVHPPWALGQDHTVFRTVQRLF